MKKRSIKKKPAEPSETKKAFKREIDQLSALIVALTRARENAVASSALWYKRLSAAKMDVFEQAQSYLRISEEQSRKGNEIANFGAGIYKACALDLNALAGKISVTDPE